MRDRNQEGYHDPTACTACTAVRNVMRIQSAGCLAYRIGETCQAVGSGRPEGGGRCGQRRTCCQDTGRG